MGRRNTDIERADADEGQDVEREEPTEEPTDDPAGTEGTAVEEENVEGS